MNYPSANKPVPIYALDEKLHGFSMVVASSNNGAAENITRELPNAKKLDEIYEEADYFSELATALINSAEPEDEEDEDEDEQPDPIKAWGLVSAPLGKKKNRNIFVNTLNKYDTVKGADGEQKKVQAPYNIFRLLREAKQSTSWTDVRNGFADALKEVHRIKAELRSVARLGAPIGEFEDAARVSDAELEVLRQRFSNLRNDQPVLAQEVEKRQKRALDLQTALNNLLPSRPGFFAKLFHTAAFRNWANQWHVALEKQRQKQLQTSEAELEKCRQSLSLFPEQLKQAEARLATLGDKVENARVAQAKACGKGYVGLSELRQMSAEVREQTLPLSNTALHDARAELFLRALNVHKAIDDHKYIKGFPSYS